MVLVGSATESVEQKENVARCVGCSWRGGGQLGVRRWARRNEPSPNRMSFDRHSSFTVRTQRSAYEFRFGLRAGSRRHLTPPAASVSRNDAQYFVSRSCNK